MRCRVLDGWLGSFVLRLQQRLTQIQQYRHTSGRRASYIQSELLAAVLNMLLYFRNRYIIVANISIQCYLLNCTYH